MQQTSEMQTYDTTKGRKKKPVSRRGVARDFSFSLGNSEKPEASLAVWRSARGEERSAAQIGQNL
jgi:hypothetical protein